MAKFGLPPAMSAISSKSPPNDDVWESTDHEVVDKPWDKMQEEFSNVGRHSVFFRIALSDDSRLAIERASRLERNLRFKRGLILDLQR